MICKCEKEMSVRSFDSGPPGRRLYSCDCGWTLFACDDWYQWSKDGETEDSRDVQKAELQLKPPPLTVEKLIDILEDFPANTRVVYRNHEAGIENAVRCQTAQIALDVNGPFVGPHGLVVSVDDYPGEELESVAYIS